MRTHLLGTGLLGVATALATTLVTTLAVTIGAAAPAGAEVDRQGDQRHDVVGVGPELAFEPFPERVDPDVLRLQVRHTSERLVVRLTADDLTPDFGHLVSGRVRTPAGDATFGWGAKPGRALRGGYVTADGRRCRAAEATIDTVRDVARVVVPRSCLGDAVWVRVGAGLSAYVDLDGALYVDDAQSSGVRHEAVLGPRVAAGQQPDELPSE